MTNLPPHDTDEVCRHFQQQAKFYESALQMGNRVSVAVETGNGVQDALADFNEQLRLVLPLENTTRDIQKEWDRRAYKPTGRVRVALADMTASLKRLIEQIGLAESIAKKSRDALRPALGKEERAQRMRQAYTHAST